LKTRVGRGGGFTSSKGKRGFDLRDYTNLRTVIQTSDRTTGHTARTATPILIKQTAKKEKGARNGGKVDRRTGGNGGDAIAEEKSQKSSPLRQGEKTGEGVIKPEQTRRTRSDVRAVLGKGGKGLQKAGSKKTVAI